MGESAGIGGNAGALWYRVLAVNARGTGGTAASDYASVLPAALHAVRHRRPFIAGWLSRGGGAPLELITTAGPLPEPGRPARLVSPASADTARGMRPVRMRLGRTRPARIRPAQIRPAQIRPARGAASAAAAGPESSERPGSLRRGAGRSSGCRAALSLGRARRAHRRQHACRSRPARLGTVSWPASSAGR